jgi:excisionase family DNA binding protein
MSLLSDVALIADVAFADLRRYSLSRQKGFTMATTLEKTVAPSEDDVRLAKQSSRSLSAFTGHRITCIIKSEGTKQVEMELPATVVSLLESMLTQMAQGNAVVLMPVNAQLTTQQAADILGISRPFLVAEMTNGKLSYQKIGTHRRIAFADLMQYRQKMSEESNAAMDTLVTEAQELNLGY